MGGGNNQKAHVKSVNRRIKKQKKWYKWKPKSKMTKTYLNILMMTINVNGLKN